MKKIAVFTGTRAEYGLLYLILKGLKSNSTIDLQLLVGGTHLLTDFGYTIKHIIDDGFTITEELDYLLASDSPVGISKSLARATIAAAEVFANNKPDLLVLLGDRFEALALAQAAMIAGVPIAHIHGGELTEAAMDDSIRHAITKMSHLHFTSTEVYRQRLLQLGEQPSTVFNVGAPGIDNIVKLPLLSKQHLSQKLNIDLSAAYFLVTYHPETLSHKSSIESLKSLLTSFEHYQDYKLIITYPNADMYGRSLIDALEFFAKTNKDRVFLYESIGQINYLSAMKYASLVIGNSSSGIIEAPSFHVPTVNIGDRQKGRLASESVINCSDDVVDIVAAIKWALSDSFKEQALTASNPYGEGDACPKIIDKLVNHEIKTLNKPFYDIEFDHVL